MTKYKLSLLIAFALVWLWAAWHPVYPHDWLLENYLVFLFVPIILVVSRYFKLSNVSYTLITLFMIMHVIGSHYTYAEVPIGYWIQNTFGFERNMYDRVVHFSFGFLLAYPMREIVVRITKAKGFWSFYLPIDVILAGACVYELIEWAGAISLDPQAGLAFLGSQGDIWDAQKDMFVAGVGAILAMIIIFIINMVYNKNLWKEVRESFKIEKGDHPLGEDQLRHFVRGKK